jgi:hypothetical protein
MSLICGCNSQALVAAHFLDSVRRNQLESEGDIQKSPAQGIEGTAKFSTQ